VSTFNVFFRPLNKYEQKLNDDFIESDSSVSFISNTNDNECKLCDEGGSLLCCDGCPNSFHFGCIGMKERPIGKWLCKNCTKR
jgi:hypothetical protein